jgi:hypothetical protein
MAFAKFEIDFNSFYFDDQVRAVPTGLEIEVN